MIKKFFFENFKSFEKAELTVQDFTTLIGTNASGKSNAIEGILVLSELVRGRDVSDVLDGSKNSGGGIRGGSKGCCRGNATRFSLGCLIAGTDSEDFLYAVEIDTEERIITRNYCVVNPYLKSGGIKEQFNPYATDFPKSNMMPLENIPSMGEVFFNLFSVPYDGQRSDVNAMREFVDSLKSTLNRILFLDPIPSAIRAAGYVPKDEVELKANCENLSAVLYKLCQSKESKKLLLRIIQNLPENEIQDIEFADTRLNDVIFELKEQFGTYDARSLSDGTLRCLSVLAAVLSQKEESMIVIEEIDNGVHPSRAQKLIESVSEIARERKLQVIITTHNETLLNGLSKENLSGVSVVYRNRDNGASNFIPLTEIQGFHRLMAMGGLGTVSASGELTKYIKDPPKQSADLSWMEG